jgi:hypothetical protein
MISPSWNRFFQTAQRITNESKSLLYSLVRMVVASQDIKNKSMISSFKDEIVTIAKRDHNSVAVSILTMDRNLGLIRYYGILPYFTQLLQRQQQRRSFSGNGDNNTKEVLETISTKGSRNNDNNSGISSSSTTNTPPQQQTPSRAKIAFMITSAQKVALIEKLGYDLSQVKKMKPIEALMAIENNISPGNDETIAKLVKENEELLKEEAMRKKQELSTKQTGFSSSYFAHGWYEVIQESKTNDGQELFSSSTTTVIALYPTEEEALQCVKIKEEFAVQNNKNSNDGNTITGSSNNITTSYYVRKKVGQ